MVVQNIIERIHQTHKTENSDITLQSNNGKVHTTRLFLASWSKFWKEVLLGLDNGEEIVIVIEDVSKSVLNKLCEFLNTGKVNISGAQENIEVIEGLEMLLPDLDLSDQKKLVIEDAEETDMETDYDKFRYEVTENFICKICLRYFSSKQKRDNHIQNIHTKKKRYNCKVCEKIIFSKDGLVSHMKTHTRSSHHQCPDCKKIYKNKSNLLRHFKSVGHSYLDKLEREKRIFECSECDFTTNRVDSLYRHERNKHGLYNKKLDAISKTIEKKGDVECSKCSKKFTDTKLAKEHFLQESCQPIKCKECGKLFNKRADLKLHIRDVHTENCFSCPTCDKEFKQIRNMNRHHKTCKLKETGRNEEMRKEASLDKTNSKKK